MFLMSIKTKKSFNFGTEPKSCHGEKILEIMGTPLISDNSK